ncbi:uncharacterized protein LOC120359578 [Solenopsis invicta]|uniref:uncharacterized protein LOC120359578 n=1 Tax=Solenopsis invicta TaxID=13686 RepID=UPI00193D301A|nr:uncharacterized protein LOC120359578 [Solenopsis invicta]
MKPEIFENLENRLGPLLFNPEAIGRPAIPIHTQLLATIWLLSTPDSFRSVGEKFDMSKSSLNDSVRRVVQSLNSVANEVITWPIGEQLAASKEKFNHLGDTPMPGVIGEVALHYKCRKMQYAIVLQAICDADLRLIDCFTGYPGSEQKRFNKILSQKRQTIERAFALLKGRFRRLKFLDMSRLDLIPFFILAACVLHNICLQSNDDVEDFIGEGREPEEQGNHDREIEDNDERQEFADGEIKRNYVCLVVSGRQ